MSADTRSRKVGTDNPPDAPPASTVLTLWVFIDREIAGVVVAVAMLPVMKAGNVGNETLVT
jgi:hypothetical protein